MNQLIAIYRRRFLQCETDSDLAALMTDMERKFHIPLLKSEAWERNNSELMTLYRRISDSRTTI